MIKKKLLMMLPLLTFFALSSCAITKEVVKVENPITDNGKVSNDERYAIYLLALDSGYTGTYEEWLESIQGDKVELRVYQGNVEWKYSKENSSMWRFLYSLADLKGDNGDNGLSAYELYKKYHPDYTKTEEEWVNEFYPDPVIKTKYTVSVDYDQSKLNISGAGSYEEGSTVHLKVNSVASGYVFDGWYLSNNPLISVSRENDLYFDIDENVSLIAKYKEDSSGDTPHDQPTTQVFQINVTYDSTLLDVTYNQTVEYGNDTTLNAKVLDNQYEFDGWYENDNLLSSSSEYTIKSVTSAHFIEAKVKYIGDVVINNDIITISNIDTIERAKYFHSSYEEIILENVNYIDISAFEQSSLNTLRLNNVKRVGQDAFNGCENLTTIVIEEGLEYIESGAFDGCSNLETIILPESLKYIGASAFANCPKLKSVTFKDYSNWYYSFSDNANDGYSIDFSNVTTSATYITSDTYCYYNFIKKEA